MMICGFAKRLAVLSVWLALLPATAQAWGDEGHEIVALIADHYLDPAVRERVAALLATDTSHLTPTTGMADEATWADRFRDSDRGGGRRGDARPNYESTREWHYVDLELGNPDLDSACFHHPSLPAGAAASAGPADDCIVDKIEEFRRELAAPRTAAPERLLALQFLLHFVGDLHQPLHAADDADRGGNGKRVKAVGFRAGTLHQYWDSVFVERLGESSAGVAAALIAGISAADQKAWSAGTPADWAEQSFELARTVAYGRLPAPGARHVYMLEADYMSAAQAAVRLQLARGGVRLAKILNDALGR
jgi:hypothetical protein